VRLAYDDRGQALGEAARMPAPPPLPGEPLAVLRRGMWRVVNERNGTGAPARIDLPGFELCGKTGSAQTVPRVLNSVYTLAWPDGRRAEVVAISPDDAVAGFPGERPAVAGWRANERYPALLEGEKLPAHAWFIGYTQSAATPRGAPPRGPAYAISVLIEFGGGGGRVAAPVARRIAERLLRAPLPTSW
jgi:cell division protein FtsI/penicillin-binding protein 2